ncbi:hypothetical protein CY34DRAFT_147900 [Suillus luteus UH-Slu-Lm8-n1]|uniref:Unplaced genomic scaffold CY34scaffold_11, whole genome shotgun sequence n=1 Tax=Suillus luteus UH-Slu-Lm8-n1 TaxID=930992 RepID=A0A0D0BYJ4_9AGAM|nr:hypothetical protein CY34DRAFT_147900 [Suillus luteus UH-Slu-Lm8-n1]
MFESKWEKDLCKRVRREYQYTVTTTPTYKESTRRIRQSVYYCDFVCHSQVYVQRDSDELLDKH